MSNSERTKISMQNSSRKCFLQTFQDPTGILTSSVDQCLYDYFERSSWTYVYFCLPSNRQFLLVLRRARNNRGRHRRTDTIYDLYALAWYSSRVSVSKLSSLKMRTRDTSGANVMHIHEWLVLVNQACHAAILFCVLRWTTSLSVPDNRL